MSSIVINNTSLQVIEYMGKRVVTLAQVDSVHGRPEGTAGRNFREHKHRLIEGDDYFVVSADEIRRNNPGAIPDALRRNDVILLAEPGYLMLVKSFTDDLAWSVQRQLTNNYFRNRSQARELSKLEVLQQALESEQARIKAEEALALAAPKVEYVDRYVAANGSMGFRQVAKLLTAKEPEFRAFLEDSKILYRLAGVLTPYQNHIEAGRFSIKTGVNQVNEHAFAHARFTPKGVQWIAGLWSQHQVRLKQSGEVTA